MSQLALDLSRPPALAASDFLAAACNQEAGAWISRWPDWPGFALALAGPAGCGKSHLAQIWARRSASRVIAASDIGGQRLGEDDGAGGLVIEDADRGVDEAALFHLFNRLQAAGRPLLLTGRLPPSRWPLTLADLRSRLASLPLAEIGGPDESLLAALLVKLFADRQLRIDPDVIGFVVPRLERSFAAAQTLVAQLDQAALAAQRRVTVPLVRSLLDGGEQPFSETVPAV